MSERQVFDVIVIGAGPGGYSAAIRLVQLGKRVALVEKKAMGGTCLNVGCIPTKTLLSSATALHQIKKAEEFGISVGEVKVHYEKWKARKDQIVGKIRQSLEGLIKINGITTFRGEASFEGPQEVKVQGEDNVYLKAEHVLLATGSCPTEIPAFPFDGKRILSSTNLLEITELPRTLCIVGGGYIGCEFASLFAEVGVKVTILEAMPSILALQGTKIAQFMTKSFTKRGVEIKTNVKVTGMENTGDQVEVALEDGTKLSYDLALVSVGRRPYVKGLYIEKAGLQVNEKGFLDVNTKMQTEVPGIYAIGDVTGKAMLAHVAAHQGMVAAANIAGHTEEMRYHAVPAVIFTEPEIATVGLTLDQVQEQGLEVAIGTFPFQASAKAHASIATEGYTEVLTHPKTGEILGATVIGHEAANLIAEMALAMENELTVDSIIQTIHAHPTIAEGWLEAALYAMDRPINFPPRKK